MNRLSPTQSFVWIGKSNLLLNVALGQSSLSTPNTMKILDVNNSSLNVVNGKESVALHEEKVDVDYVFKVWLADNVTQGDTAVDVNQFKSALLGNCRVER